MTESQTEPQTVSQVLRPAVAELSAAGVESAAHDARILMAEAINREADIRTTAPVTAMDLVLRGGDPAPPGFGELLARRVAREPLQLILGVGTVVGLDLPVAPGLFIPRPETDLLIEWAAGQVEDRVAVVTGASDSLTARLSEPSVTVIDLCSGPGTVTLGLAHLLTTRGIADRVDLRLVGLEIDPAAVTAATQATASWVDQGFISNRIAIEFHQADVSTPAPLVRHGLVAAADVVVSNPPYVPESTEVSPEVRQDPHRAVFSGADGLDLLRTMAEVVDVAAAPVAAVGIEHDDSNGAGVRDLLAQVGVQDLEQHRDFAGRDRFVTGRVHRDPGHRPDH